MTQQLRTASTLPATEAKAPRVQRDRDLDVARIFAAILILLIHASQEYWKAGGEGLFDRLPWVIVGSLSLWGRVPFFFFLAGYFAARSLNKGAGSSWQYVKKRSSVLIPPYLFWNLLSAILIYVAVAGGFHMVKSDRIDGAAFFMRIVGIGLHPADASMWFIRDLLICSCLAPLLNRLGMWILIPCVALAVVPEIPIHLVDVGCPRPSSLGYFGLGMLLTLVPRGTTARFFPRPGLALLLCLGVGVVFLVGDFPQPALGGCSLGALGILLAGRFVDQSLPRLAAWMSRHAKASFVVFAANSPFLAVARQIYIHYHLPLPVWVYFVVVIVIFFALCLGFHAWVERYFPKALIVITGGR